MFENEIFEPCLVLKLKWGWRGGAIYFVFQRKSGLYRRSHRKCTIKKGVLKNLANFTGKHLYWSLFSNKITDVNVAKFLRTLVYRTPTGDFFCSLYYGSVLNNDILHFRSFCR